MISVDLELISRIRSRLKFIENSDDGLMGKRLPKHKGYLKWWGRIQRLRPLKTVGKF